MCNCTKKFTIVSIFVLFVGTPIYGQWNFKEIVESDKYIVALKSRDITQIKNYNGPPIITPYDIYGTGSIIKKQLDIHPVEEKYKKYVKCYILSCAHLNKNQPIIATFFDLKVGNCTVVKEDKKRDLLLLSTWCLPGIQEIQIGDVPEVGTEICSLGMGGFSGKPPSENTIRKFTGVVYPYINEYIFIDSPFINGDSGGAVIQNEKLIGVISGGSEIFKNNLHWPGRVCSNIKEFLKDEIK